MMDERIKSFLQGLNYPQVINSYYGYTEITPQAKQSVRIFNGRAVSDPEKKKYVQQLRLGFQETFGYLELYESLRITAVFAFKRTKKSAPEEPLSFVRHDVKPDVDNLEKPCFDALSEALVIHDAKIVEAHCYKIRFDVPGVYLRIDTVTDYLPYKG